MNIQTGNFSRKLWIPSCYKARNRIVRTAETACLLEQIAPLALFIPSELPTCSGCPLSRNGDLPARNLARMMQRFPRSLVLSFFGSVLNEPESPADYVHIIVDAIGIGRVSNQYEVPIQYQ